MIITDVLQAQHQFLVDETVNVESEVGHTVVHFDDPVITLVVRIIPEMDLPKRKRRASQDVEVEVLLHVLNDDSPIHQRGERTESPQWDTSGGAGIRHAGGMHTRGRDERSL